MVNVKVSQIHKDDGLCGQWDSRLSGLFILVDRQRFLYILRGPCKVKKEKKNNNNSNNWLLKYSCRTYITVHQRGHSRDALHNVLDNDSSFTSISRIRRLSLFIVVAITISAMSQCRIQTLVFLSAILYALSFRPTKNYFNSVFNFCITIFLSCVPYIKLVLALNLLTSHVWCCGSPFVTLKQFSQHYLLWCW